MIYLLFTDCNLIMHTAPCTAPGAPPQKFLAEAEDSSSIRVTWAPPPEDKQHGDIMYYKIFFLENNEPDALTKEVTISNPNTREYVIDQLRKWTEYKIWVLAGTNVGDGPYTEQILIRTEEDGTFTYTFSFTDIPKYFNTVCQNFCQKNTQNTLHFVTVSL